MVQRSLRLQLVLAVELGKKSFLGHTCFEDKEIMKAMIMRSEAVGGQERLLAEVQPQLQ